MKRVLQLGACASAVLAGVLVPASTAQAATATTKAAEATADYVCESLTTHFSWSGVWMEGINCTGPTDLWIGYRTITTTQGTAVWQCLNWSYRADESAPVKATSCNLAG